MSYLLMKNSERGNNSGGSGMRNREKEENEKKGRNLKRREEEKDGSLLETILCQRRRLLKRTWQRLLRLDRDKRNPMRGEEIRGGGKQSYGGKRAQLRDQNQKNNAGPPKSCFGRKKRKGNQKNFSQPGRG